MAAAMISVCSLIVFVPFNAGPTHRRLRVPQGVSCDLPQVAGTVSMHYPDSLHTHGKSARSHVLRLFESLRQAATG